MNYVFCDVFAEASFKAFHFTAEAIILLVLCPQISDLTAKLSNEAVFLVVEIGSGFVILQKGD